jgi:hypothetical protein
MLTEEQRAANMAAYEKERDEILRQYEKQQRHEKALRDEAALLIENYSSNEELIAMSKRPPVVMTYIDGDSYGGDSTAWAGVGMPLVITFDGGRYDKYNRCGDEDPREDYAEDLAALAGHPEALAVLQGWVDEACEACGIDNDDEEDDDE